MALGIPFDTERFDNIQLYPNRFDQDILTRLRLSFLTSDTIIERGGTVQVKKDVDFKSDFDTFNEECSV